MAPPLLRKRKDLDKELVGFEQQRIVSSEDFDEFMEELVEDERAANGLHIGSLDEYNKLQMVRRTYEAFLLTLKKYRGEITEDTDSLADEVLFPEGDLVRQQFQH